MFHRKPLTINPNRWGKGYSHVSISEEGDVGIKESSFGFWRIMKFIFYPGTTALNFRAAIWHFMLCLLIVVFWSVKDPPFYIEFNKMWAKQTIFPNYTQTTFCNGTDYADLGVNAWFDCVRPQFDEWKDYNKAEDIPIYSPVLVKGEKFRLAFLCLLFEIITWLMHSWIWYLDYAYDNLYTKRLKEQLQPYRWIEYSITASIMFWCALALSRVQDQFLLISLFLNSFALNFVGGCCFEGFYWAERNATDELNLKNVFRRLKWACFITSWAFFIIQTWTSWDALNTIIAPYLDLPTSVFWDELFQIVTYVNVGITATFFLFPIIHLYQFLPTAWNGRTEDEQIVAYRKGEISFIWASFISKTVLTGIMTFASFQRDDQ